MDAVTPPAAWPHSGERPWARGKTSLGRRGGMADGSVGTRWHLSCGPHDHAPLGAFRPRRPLARPRQERWRTNLGLTLLNTVLVRVTVGGVAYTAAVFAAEKGVGLLYWRPLPAWAAAAMTLLVLDFAIYLQHVLFHAVPVLWRLHPMPPADLDVD